MPEYTSAYITAEKLEQISEYEVSALPYPEVSLSQEEISKFVRYLEARARAADAMAQRIMRSDQPLKERGPEWWEQEGKALAKRKRAQLELSADVYKKCASLLVPHRDDSSALEAASGIDFSLLHHANFLLIQSGPASHHPQARVSASADSPSNAEPDPFENWIEKYRDQLEKHADCFVAINPALGAEGLVLFDQSEQEFTRRLLDLYARDPEVRTRLLVAHASIYA